MLSPSISKLRDELIEYLQDMDCVTASEVGFVAGYMDAMWALQEPEEAYDISLYKQPAKTSQDVLAAERDIVVKMVKQELDAATGQSWDVDWQLVNYPSIGDFDITCHCAMSNGTKLGKRYEYNLNTMSVLDIAKEVVTETLEFYTISTHRHRSSYMNTMVPEVKRILTEKTQETWDIDWGYNTTHTWVAFNLRGVVSGTHRVDVNDNMDKQVESVVNAIYNDYIYKVKRHDESQNAKTS